MEGYVRISWRLLVMGVVLGGAIVAQPVQAQEIVTGFHGYRWGTPRAAIEELIGTEQVGEKDGLAIYSAEVEVEGRFALAGFYFHPLTETLLEGAYLLTAPVEECDRVWALLARSVVRSYPGLQRTDDTASKADAPRDVYDSDCEYFVFNAHQESWRTDFDNPRPPGDKVWMFIRAVERSPRFTVVYRGAAGTEWALRR